MSYPIGTPVHTTILDMDALPFGAVVVSPCIVTAIHGDGEVTTREVPEYREAHAYCERIVDNGGTILSVVEFERDLSTGEASAYVRNY